jgi:hypothetical protein
MAIKMLTRMLIATASFEAISRAIDATAAGGGDKIEGPDKARSIYFNGWIICEGE